jgi:RNA polymerase sigma-70 factor (ECF subfamily)
MRRDADPNASVDPIDAETLYRAHAAFVASYLRHMGTRESELDDCVQEVFIMAHRKGGYRPGTAAPRSWLAGIAFRVWQTRRRSLSRRAAHSDAELDGVPDGACSPGERLEVQRALERVQRALDTLSPIHRTAFVMYEIEGESCESMAAMWGVPLGTVHSRLHHARQRFTQAYEQEAQPVRGER